MNWLCFGGWALGAALSLAGALLTEGNAHAEHGWLMGVGLAGMVWFAALWWTADKVAER